MNDSDVVRGGEWTACLARKPGRFQRIKLYAALEAVRDGLSLQELHDEVGATIGELPEIEDRDDVGVPDRTGRDRFVQETLEHVAGRSLLQDLDGDFLADALVNGTVHNAHPTLAENLRESVTVDLLADVGDRI